MEALFLNTPLHFYLVPFQCEVNLMNSNFIQFWIFELNSVKIELLKFSSSTTFLDTLPYGLTAQMMRGSCHVLRLHFWLYEDSIGPDTGTSIRPCLSITKKVTDYFSVDSLIE